MARKRKSYRSRKKRGNAIRITLIFFAVLLLSAGALLGFAWWGKNLGTIVSTTGSQTTQTSASTGVGGVESETVPAEPTSSVPAVSGGRVYMQLSKYSTREAFEQEVNAIIQAGFAEVILDIKDLHGRIYFSTDNEVAAACGAAMPNPALVPLKEITAYLRANGFVVYGRLTAFSDDLAALTLPEYTLNLEDGTRFADLNSHWTNIYVKNARDYVTAIAAEAAGFGFDGIILDRFYLPVTNLSLKIDSAEPCTEIVEQFVSEIRRALDDVSPDIKLLLYLPSETEGKSAQTGADGQALAALVDTVLTAFPNSSN